MPPLSPPTATITAVTTSIITTLLATSLYFFYCKTIQTTIHQIQHVISIPPSITFPLGNLHTWKNLLQANQSILHLVNTNKPIVAQFMFWKMGIAVVKGEHVDVIFKSSVSRQMTPSILNFLGLYHIKKFMGSKSVGIAEGSRWKELRKGIANSLKPDYVRSLYPMFHERIMDAQQYIIVTSIEKQSRLLDISPLMHALTIDIVCTTIFKSPMGALQAMLNGKSNELVDAFSFAANEMARRTSSSFNPFDWIYFPYFNQLGRAHRIINQKMNHFLDQVIENKQETTIVSHLLTLESMENNNNNNDNSVRQAIIDQIKTLVWAGHDTTASSCSFCFRLLAEYPEIQNRLRNSLKNELGNEEKILANRELDAIVWETLRIHPPALWTNRGMTEDVIFDNGFKLEKGNVALIPIYAVHHSTMNWSRPDEFLPFERFIDGMDGEIIKNKGRLIPFGSGNRICPGNGLAIIEIKLIVSDLICRFKFLVPPPTAGGSNSKLPEIKAVGMFQTIENNVLEIVEL
jgi:cytochrome P450